MALRTQSVLPVVLLRYRQLLRGFSTHDANREQQQQQEQEQQPKAPIKAEGNAYEVLGLSESSSEGSIRATFRKLAKATHPDLQTDTSTAQFIRILAAYEILSDPAKRAEYDKHLRSKRGLAKTQPNASRTREASSGSYDTGGGFSSSSGFSEQRDSTASSSSSSSTEVVSWLKGYRAMIKDMVSRQEIGRGEGGWEEELRWETQSALRRAYFGPPVSEQEGLPECFEAEERAQSEVEDVLHLVSGRQLFGSVRQVQNPALEAQHESPFLLRSHALEVRSDNNAPDMSSTSQSGSLDEVSDLTRGYHSLRGDNGAAVPIHKTAEGTPFVDLELQLFGNVVARSIRVPSRHEGPSGDTDSDEQEDCIYVYLSSEQVEDATGFVDGTLAGDTQFSRTLLGTIRGLRSTCDRKVCFAHAPDGRRTHLILQHTTPLVKHMQWFRVGEESAACECRCRRASTLPSRFWIFEPRTDTHNVGGWYIETFYQSRRSSRASNRSHWKKARSENEKFVRKDADKMADLLHPAMYIMAAAYKTLDEEGKAARKREESLQNQIKKKLAEDLPRIRSGFAHWWKQKWSPSNFVPVQD